MRLGFFGDYWDSKKMERDAAIEGGWCTVWQVGRRIHVSAEFNDAFRIGARELAGTWRDRTNTWTFNSRSKRLILELCEANYGKEMVRDNTL